MGNITFEEWLSGASFYIGYCRYSQSGDWEFCVTSNYDYDENLKEATENLDAGDIPALQGWDYIQDNAEFYATDKNPAKAMQKVIKQMNDTYNKELS